MPNYNAQAPRYSIFPGDVTLAFTNEAPTAGQASQQFALPSYAGFPENGRTIRWQISFASAPTSVNIQLQTAINDADAPYAAPTGAANMSSTLTTGDNLVATAVRANFVRAKVIAISRGVARDGANSRIGFWRSSLRFAPGGDFPDDTSRVWARNDNVRGMGCRSKMTTRPPTGRSIVDAR
jgi:hypothetical protein